jgi:chromate transporter
MKLGFISFSGPAGQIAIMHQELVENRRWISESPRTQFLYGAAWSGSSATLPPWLADAQDLGRSDGEFVIYPSLTFYSYRVVVDLYRLGDVAIIAVSFTALNPPWRQSCCRRRIASAPVR